MSHRSVLDGLLTLLLMQSVCKNRLSRQKAVRLYLKGNHQWATTNSRPKKAFGYSTRYSALKMLLRHPSEGDCKYFLDYQDGEPVFRLAEVPSKPTLPRDEFDVIFGEVMVELFGPGPEGDEIVPQKLAKQFPGRSLPRLLMARAWSQKPGAK